QMPKRVDAQAKPISGIRIEKVTVWDGGGGANGSGAATAKFSSSLITSLPPLQELAKQAERKRPDYLGKMELSPEQPASEEYRLGCGMFRRREPKGGRSVTRFSETALFPGKRLGRPKEFAQDERLSYAGALPE